VDRITHGVWLYSKLHYFIALPNTGSQFSRDQRFITTFFTQYLVKNQSHIHYAALTLNTASHHSLAHSESADYQTALPAASFTSVFHDASISLTTFAGIGT